MTIMHLHDPVINRALGIDSDAQMDEALAVIAQLRTAGADADSLRDERNEYMRALSRARDERDSARDTADSYSRKAAEWELLTARIACMERHHRETEVQRDAAYAVLHHLTAGHAP